MEKPEEILLDLSGIINSETMHEYLSTRLNFPAYYGYNFDAFWDCITDEQLSDMPNTLIVEGLKALKKHLPDEHNKLLNCLKDYGKKFPHRKVFLEQNSPSGEGIKFEN